MAEPNDPRVDRLIAAVHALEDARKADSEVLDRLRGELTAAQRDAAEARTDAAQAKAETATYQAELTALARRSDLDRVMERLDGLDRAVAGTSESTRSFEANVGSIREQLAKVSRALGKVAPASDLRSLAARSEQLDDRIQARLNQIASDLSGTAKAISVIEERFDEFEATSPGVTQVPQPDEEQLAAIESIRGRVTMIEDRLSSIGDYFDEVVSNAETEMERVAADLRAELGTVEDRVNGHDVALLATAGEVGVLPDTIRLVSAQSDRVDRLERANERIRRSVVDVDQQLSGADGVKARLEQLANVVVERTGIAAIDASLESRFVDLQTRFEAVRSDRDAHTQLVERLADLERRLDRVRT